jgi:hypothetical protein
MGEPRDRHEQTRRRAQQDIQAVVRRFREDPSQWQELRQRLVEAENDDARARVLVDFATQEGALARLAATDPQGPVAATPTVTTVTVTTVTTV